MLLWSFITLLACAQALTSDDMQVQRSLNAEYEFILDAIKTWTMGAKLGSRQAIQALSPRLEEDRQSLSVLFLVNSSSVPSANAVSQRACQTMMALSEAVLPLINNSREQTSRFADALVSSILPAHYQLATIYTARATFGHDTADISPQLQVVARYALAKLPNANNGSFVHQIRPVLASMQSPAHVVSQANADLFHHQWHQWVKFHAPVNTTCVDADAIAAVKLGAPLISDWLDNVQQLDSIEIEFDPHLTPSQEDVLGAVVRSLGGIIGPNGTLPSLQALVKQPCPSCGDALNETAAITTILNRSLASMRAADLSILADLLVPAIVGFRDIDRAIATSCNATASVAMQSMLDKMGQSLADHILQLTGRNEEHVMAATRLIHLLRARLGLDVFQKAGVELLQRIAQRVEASTKESLQRTVVTKTLKMLETLWLRV